MDNKILIYLKGADQNGKYMRDIFGFYVDGKMRNYLLKQRITNLEIFPAIQNNKGSLQMYFQYYNLFVIMEFDETGYEYSIHTQNCSANDLEHSIVTNLYSTDFAIEVFLIHFFRLLKEDVRLIKTSQTIEKKKLYKIMSSICYTLTFFIIAVPSAYVLITHNTIQAGPWLGIVIFIPLVISQIFDFLASKE